MSEPFRHKMSVGFTGMGKTFHAKQRIKRYLHYKQQVIVYPGTGDTSFPNGVRYAWDEDELEGLLNNPEYFGAFVILDECAALYGEVTRKNHPTTYNLFMKGRHKGFTCWALTQYPTSIPPRVRINCGERFIFSIPDDAAADLIWKDCGRIDYNGVPLRDAILQLQPYEYFHYIHPGQITKYTP
ncbi:MAG: hypothetical protein H6863_06560 [Rhodospirillales bacterium]|nr:hypothetical protein [Rhodospirillales bacterium]